MLIAAHRDPHFDGLAANDDRTTPGLTDDRSSASETSSELDDAFYITECVAPSATLLDANPDGGSTSSSPVKQKAAVLNSPLFIREKPPDQTLVSGRTLRTLLSLPMCILFEILRHLTPCDLVHLSEVNQKLRHLLLSLQSSLLWRNALCIDSLENRNISSTTGRRRASRCFRAEFIVRGVYEEVLATFPSRMIIFMPHLQDILHLPAIRRAVLDGVGANERARARVKASILSAFPSIRAWFRERRETLLLSLPDSWIIPPPILSPYHIVLETKTSVFDLCGYLQLERFDLAINVAYCISTQTARGDCGETLFGRQMFAHRCSSGCRWPLLRVQPFYRASGFVRKLLAMLGLDVKKTTGEKMDGMDGRFVCMDCAEREGMRRERPWRDVVEHCVKAHAFSVEGKEAWRILEGGEKDYIERHPLATVADARWGSCGRLAHAKHETARTVHYLTTQDHPLVHLFRDGARPRSVSCSEHF